MEDDVYLKLHHRLSPFQLHCHYNVYNMPWADERTTGIHKKLMEIDQNDWHPPNSIIKLSKTFDDVNASKFYPDRPFPSHCTYTVYNTLPADERTTGTDKKLMEIDQNDWHPSNSIIELNKAFDDVHASKSYPDRPFPSHHTYTVYITLQADERTTGINKKLMVTDQLKQRSQQRNNTKECDAKKILYPITTCNPMLQLKLILQSIRTNPRTTPPQFLDPTSAWGSDYLSQIPPPHLIWAMERNDKKPKNRLVRMRCQIFPVFRGLIKAKTCFASFPEFFDEACQ